MRKIVFAVTNDLNYDQRMIRICTALAQEGFDVRLIGRRKTSSLPVKERSFSQKRLKPWFEKGKLFYLEFNLRLFFWLLFEKFDAVCAVDLDTIAPCYFSSRLKGKKVIFDAHELFTEVPEVLERPRTKLFWKWIEEFFIPRIPYRYTVCVSLREEFFRRYHQPFEVIRNVPLASQYPGKASPDLSHPIILYQGALNEGRGLEQMIRAMQDLPKATLWIAGEGDLSAFLRNMTQQLQLESRVHFLGYLLPEALAQRTLQATLGINLLENKGLNYYFSLANKAFDYIQAGLPSIHMDFPEYRRIHEQFGVFKLIPTLEKENIVEAVQALIDHPETYLTLQQNCHQAALQLTWEKESKKLIDLYRRWLL